MRKCRNCNVEMLEHPRMYMTSWVTGSSIPYGSQLKIEKERKGLGKAIGFVADTALQQNLQTAVCPCCGLVENYLNKDGLNAVKQYLASHK